MKITGCLIAIALCLCLGCGKSDPSSPAATTPATNAAHDAAVEAYMAKFERSPKTQPDAVTDASASEQAGEPAPDFDPRFTSTPGVAPANSEAMNREMVAAALAASPPPASAETAPTEDPRQATAEKPPLVIPVARRGRDGMFDITFDHIKFEMEKESPFDRSLLTSQVESLDGEPIRLRGYILNTAYQELSQFVLVRDNLECCFGKGAALYDCVVVKMERGRTANFTVRPVTVEGVFRVSEMKDPFDDTKTVAIYEMVGKSVR